MLRRVEEELRTRGKVQSVQARTLVNEPSLSLR